MTDGKDFLMMHRIKRIERNNFGLQAKLHAASRHHTRGLTSPG
jgi:hypothetical protein